jgi:hypothetical protein
MARAGCGAQPVEGANRLLPILWGDAGPPIFDADPQLPRPKTRTDRYRRLAKLERAASFDVIEYPGRAVGYLIKPLYLTKSLL